MKLLLLLIVIIGFAILCWLGLVVAMKQKDDEI